MHNAHVYFLIHVSLVTINSLTYILDCMAAVAQDLLSAPASETYVNVCSRSVKRGQQARVIG